MFSPEGAMKIVETYFGDDDDKLKITKDFIQACEGGKFKLDENVDDGKSCIVEETGQVFQLNHGGTQFKGFLLQN